MPPKDQKHLEFVSKWFHQAAEDLRLANYGMEAKPPFLKGSAFHAQQCAEKSIKGFLLYHGQKIPRTHDLRGLAKLACAIKPDLQSLFEPVGTLTKYITASRYPTDINFSEEIVRNAISIATEVFNQLHDETVGSGNLPLKL